MGLPFRGLSRIRAVIPPNPAGTEGEGGCTAQGVSAVCVSRLLQGTLQHMGALQVIPHCVI